MKRFFALLLCCVLLLAAAPVKAEREDFYTWLSASTYLVGAPAWGKAPTPIVWEPYFANYNFPMYVLRGVSRECQQWNGTPINSLGLEPTSGSNMRSYPDFSTNNNIIHKVHGNETVFIYFSFYFPYNNRTWYYAATESGIEGFLVSTRILMLE